ncbi:hypothetical protein [Frateuria sp. STR12]|uniref:hypothetical protein n=1 Tax=Frateuria hangzhouensis TaxID=2995589 RepID=UPI00226086CD|nr:hypothetical protein [Frateuria sp. STR12]MCX7512913.1 hypothetical protein [Frateuria sp. STR12]
MNEFEWRRQLRELHAPVSPPRDLWARIDAAMEAAPTARGSSRPGWLLAASFAGLSLLAVSLSLRQGQLLEHRQTTATAATYTPWKPDDPRLAGAAIELDAAHLELKQALEQAPHSPALQRLLSRTRQQQSRLRQLDQQAG